MSTYLYASTMCMDLNHLGEEITMLTKGEIDGFHVDIADGDFTDAFIPASTLMRVRECTDLPLGVHLMVRDPLRYLNELYPSRPETIYVHYEAENPAVCLSDIRSHGCRAGLAVCAETGAEQLADILPAVDQLLLLRVPIGTTGQPAIPHVEEKIHHLVHYPERHFGISCDGAVSADVIAKWTPHGVTHFVLGMASGLFDRGADRYAICREMKEVGHKEFAFISK